MESTKWTNTTIFMVPTINIDRKQLTENGFINAYIDDGLKDEKYNDCIYLLFKPKSLSKFKYFMDMEYVRTHFLIDDYDYEGGYVVLVYMLDKKYEDDFNLIKQGKYSKVSEIFKELFPRTRDVEISRGKFEKQMSLQWKIFTKTEDLRTYWEDILNFNFTNDMELWGTFDIEKETLNINNFKELVE